MVKLCDEAKHHRFKMAAITQARLRFHVDQLSGTGIHAGVAIAFPPVQISIAAKMLEARDAVELQPFSRVRPASAQISRQMVGKLV